MLRRAPRWREAVWLLGAVALLLLAAGCGQHDVAVDFPIAAGFQPLEPLSTLATFPAGTVGDPYPQGLGPIVGVPGFDHYRSHARGYLHATLAQVYTALHDPAASYIHNSSGSPQFNGIDQGVEPFPVSFRIHYFNSTVIGDVRFDVTYRAGLLDGTDLAPVLVGERYQKTWGTDHIRVMSGSLTARAVEGAQDVTEVEMIAWLSADTQGQSNCDGTLRDLFSDLAGVLATP